MLGLDVRGEGSLNAFVGRGVAELGGVDMLVANAGIRAYINSGTTGTDPYLWTKTAYRAI